MLRIYNCIVAEHDLGLLVLATVICLFTIFAAADIAARGTTMAPAARLRWALGAGVTAGLGIWSTHFVAMLAYDPGTTFVFDPGLTALSLAIAIGIPAAGFAVALALPGRHAAPAGGAIVGGGIAVMHFVGMVAVDLPGRIEWDPVYAVAAIAIGAVAASAALDIIVIGTGRYRAGLGALVLSGGIVGLHFTAMGAVTIRPDPSIVPSGLQLSPVGMAGAISAAVLLVVGGCLLIATILRKAERLAAESERRFGLLVEGVTDYAIYMLDPCGNVANWNVGAARVKGYGAEEIVGRNFSVFYTPEDVVRGAPQRALAVARAEGKFEARAERVRKDGTRFWAHVVIDAVRDPRSGGHAGFVSITRDITPEKLAADQMEAMQRNLDRALANMGHGLAMFGADEKLVLANPRFAEIFGLAPGVVQPGLSLRDLVHAVALARVPPDPPAKADHIYAAHRKAIAGGGRSVIIEELDDGRTLSVGNNPMPDGSWVTTFEDISDRRRSEQKIAHMARHDGLTGLPNRASFNERLDDELELASRDGCRVAVVGIDLDRFKDINDSRGHAVGDEVLRIVSARLSAVLGAGEFAARFGGDEFAVMKTIGQGEDLGDFVARLERALSQPIVLDGFDITPGASLGVALFPTDAASRDSLINNADLAMYRAKAAPAERVCFYEARMDEVSRQRRALATDLWHAVENGELSLAYQVQKSVVDGRVTGYEVLLRWDHPRRGRISPAEFIPIAEECGAIVPIGAWVLREACAEAARWDGGERIAVNLSPLQLGHVDLVREVHETLLVTGLAPARLELEITETAIIADKERALHILRQIKALGITIAIDDFGTGYSSLDTLRSFPFDKIKLDRSFMNDIDSNPQSKAIIRAILALGRSLEVPVLAEGVETDDQLQMLTVEGCDEVQGFLLGRPEPIQTGLLGLRAAAAG
ncbi:bifunctional diguanylate cyclase/phosphodiesterase [Methylobrevis albus]|uniref:EAL domain-containing protein n=1 Tax=Methylobrevis albus TaxID=2793297 RepID=A0A931I3K8_9HYPH|nr:EAL domain-containing protein [Methylobrevis albus]MBH0238636.1 EAL domain-containing protein [Methylobrevis albus]